jgi:hypothetical protein
VDEIRPTSSAVQRLAKEFEGTFSPETDDCVYHDSYARLAENAKVSMYLDLFASCARSWTIRGELDAPEL